MLNIARSRYALIPQVLFLVFNSIGIVLGAIYNTRTPDLYESNAHHKVGWIATWTASAQIIIAIICLYKSHGIFESVWFERTEFLPVATNEPEISCPADLVHEYESGQCIDSESFTSSSGTSSSRLQDELECFGNLKSTKPPLMSRWFSSSKIIDFFSVHLPGSLSQYIRVISQGACRAIDRIILPFGFLVIATGVVTYSGIFRGNEVFNGLAHFIKGGIFFWYGILTLGRFIGAWADFGWAWNKKPPASFSNWKANVPSGEFVESFVIWLYGSTNVFLEHLSNWGGAWSAADMEHVSISIMFAGGGLLGMLLESQIIRDYISNAVFQSSRSLYKPDDERWQPSGHQNVSLNPMPALVIMLLGVLMGSHHQDSMTSTMVHKQWGSLLVGFALARGMTYVILFLHPPMSYMPVRPPTEVVSGFCLIAGGLIFMLSVSQH